MEASALLGQIVAQVESIELAGPYEPWMTTVGHGPRRSCGIAIALAIIHSLPLAARSAPLLDSL